MTDQLLKGVNPGDRTWKNHLDGYNRVNAINGKGPSARYEIFYLGESTVGAVRIDDYKYRFKLGLALGATGNLPETIKALREAIRLDPRHGRVW